MFEYSIGLLEDELMSLEDEIPYGKDVMKEEIYDLQLAMAVLKEYSDKPFHNFFLEIKQNSERTNNA